MVLALLLIGAITEHAEAARRPPALKGSVVWCARHRPVLTPHEAIDCYWPARSRVTAHRVAECESTASAPLHTARTRGLGRWARDYASGTHIGIFQLGPAERSTYGEYELGSASVRQVRSARRLYLARGWQPWTASRGCWS